MVGPTYNKINALTTLILQTEIAEYDNKSFFCQQKACLEKNKRKTKNATNKEAAKVGGKRKAPVANGSSKKVNQSAQMEHSVNSAMQPEQSSARNVSGQNKNATN